MPAHRLDPLGDQKQFFKQVAAGDNRFIIGGRSSRNGQRPGKEPHALAALRQPQRKALEGAFKAPLGVLFPAKARHVRPGDAVAEPGRAKPSAQHGKILEVKSPVARHERQFEPGEERVGIGPRFDHVAQAHHGLHGQILLHEPSPDDAVGNRALPGQTAENAVDEGDVCVKLGRSDENVLGSESRIVLEAGLQVLAKRLHLAQPVGSRHKADRAVGLIGQQRAVQIDDGALKPGEHAALGFRGRINVDALGLKRFACAEILNSLVDKIKRKAAGLLARSRHPGRVLRLCAPGAILHEPLGQRQVSSVLSGKEPEPVDGRAGALGVSHQVRLKPALARSVLKIDALEPEARARVLHVEPHVKCVLPRRDGAQERQEHGRHGCGHEDVHAARRARPHACKAVRQFLEVAHVLPDGRIGKLLPERPLPCVVRVRPERLGLPAPQLGLGAALLHADPLEHAVKPIGDVAAEDIRDPLGKIVDFARALALDVAAQRRKAPGEGAVPEQSPERPDQGLRGVLVGAFHSGHLFKPGADELEFIAATDACLGGNVKPQPVGGRKRRNDDFLSFKNRLGPAGLGLQVLDEARLKNFKVIAVNRVEHVCGPILIAGMEHLLPRQDFPPGRLTAAKRVIAQLFRV